MATTERPVRDVRPLAQSALAASPIFDLRYLTVEQSGDSLLLSGSVSSYYHKQLAQELVRAIAGREIEVVNTIAVL